MKGGAFERIEDTEDLAYAFNQHSDPNNINSIDKQFGRNGKYLVLYKDSSCIFPHATDIDGTDWTYLEDSPKSVATPSSVPTSWTSNLKNMSDNIGVIAEGTTAQKLIEERKQDIINIDAVPKEVKEIYFKRLQHFKCA